MLIKLGSTHTSVVMRIHRRGRLDQRRRTNLLRFFVANKGYPEKVNPHI